MELLRVDTSESYQSAEPALPSTQPPPYTPTASYAYTDPPDDYYTLNSPPTVLIFYTTTDRVGASEEASSLKTSIDACGITPRIFEDFSKESLMSAVHASVNECPSALIVFIMAHGDHFSIRDTDNVPVSIQDVICAMSYTEMDGKPKIIVIQSCRGLSSHSLTRATICDPAVVNYPRLGPNPCPEAFHLTQPDTFVVWSTLYDQDSTRNVFIPILADQMMSAHREDDLYEIVRRTTRVMQCSTSGRMQTPIQHGTLARKFPIKKFEPSPAQTLSSHVTPTAPSMAGMYAIQESLSLPPPSYEEAMRGSIPDIIKAAPEYAEEKLVKRHLTNFAEETHAQLVCTVCQTEPVKYKDCPHAECKGKAWCDGCNTLWHSKNPKRKEHQVTRVAESEVKDPAETPVKEKRGPRKDPAEKPVKEKRGPWKDPAETPPLNRNLIRITKEITSRPLASELICKVCLDAAVSVTFVPCGHLVSCLTCSTALVECPACRAYIRGTVRTFL